MATPGTIFIGKGANAQELHLSVANRHGLIAGATGTGKTSTLRVMAEGFSRAGVPVFVADVKGDIAGLSQPGEPKPFITDRAQKMGLEWKPEASPVIFWDLFGQQGHPLRATVSDIGPVLLTQILQLNETQEGVLNILFRVADEQGMLLLDLKDLRAMLQHVADNADTLTAQYGNIAVQSVGAIQRALLTLENQGADLFFGEPAAKLSEDFLTADEKGMGAIHVLAADQLLQSPKLYATFLLWMLADLYQTLPEVGDLDKPKLVFFFDEAHLLFDDAPKSLLDQVEQICRLIRSKGVGVYFCTQSPLDIPDDVLGQLGNKIQHALRAFTPKDQKSVRAVADNFRPNPKLDASQAVQELAVGEALVSFLDPKGIPAMVDRVLIAPPRGRMGTITPQERMAVKEISPFNGAYDVQVDRESAYEILVARHQTSAQTQSAPSAASGPGPTQRRWGAGRRPPAMQQPQKQQEALPPSGGSWWPFPSGQSQAPAPAPRRGYQRQTMQEAIAKSAVRSVTSAVGGGIGRAIVRGILGSILKK
jgi:DNA helicase HerA-like ATPase